MYRMSALKRVLYTLVFSVFFFIFAGVARDAAESFNPALLEIPEQITWPFMGRLIGVFSVVVLLSFWGAGVVVYRNFSGRDLSDQRRQWRD